MTDQQENKLELAVTNLGSKLITGPSAKRTFEESWLKGFLIDNQGLKERYLLDFLHKSQLTGANPALDQIYLVSYYDKKKKHKVGTTIFSYNFMRERAEREGVEPRRIDVKTESKEVFNPLSSKMEMKLVSTATYQGDGYNSSHEVVWDEYYNSRNPIWNSKPRSMLAKCAEAGLLRRLCPQAMAGMFIREEMEKETEKQIVEVENLNDMAEDILLPSDEKEPIDIEVKSAKSHRTPNLR